MKDNSLVSIIKKSDISLDDADIIKVDKKKKEIEVITEVNNERHIKKYKMYTNTYELKEEVTKKLAYKGDYSDDIKELYGDGYTQKEIANRLGISQSYVSKLLKLND